MTDIFVSGDSNGTSTTNANLIQDFALSGFSTGITTDTGNIYLNISETADTTGISTTNGSIIFRHLISGVSQGQSTTFGSLLQRYAISQGKSTANANLSDPYLSGMCFGTSTANLSSINIFNVLPYLQLVKSEIVYSSPAKTINLIFQVTNSQGVRIDSPTTPVITRVFNPQLTLLPNYPQLMNILDTGLYSFSIVMPIGTANLGSFIVDVSWTDPDTILVNSTFYQIISRMAPSFGGGYFITVV